MTRNIARTFWCVAIAATTMMFAQDGKKVNTKGGVCQVTVPASWKAGKGLDDFEAATSEDDGYVKAKALVILKPPLDFSFAEIKAVIRQSYTDAKVTKDSTTEFEMEGKLSSGELLAYRLIPVSNRRFCEVQVTYDSGMADQARKVAWSLKSGK